MRKGTFIVLALFGFAAYVLGAKAGKARYKEITETAKNFWNDPQVKKARVRATKTAKKSIEKAAKEAKKQLG